MICVAMAKAPALFAVCEVMKELGVDNWDRERWGLY